MASSRSLAKKTHSEQWWANHAPQTVIRCSGHLKSTGEQCRHEAAAGSTVCDVHGALIPAVKAKAAARLQEAADDLAKNLIDWANDPNVDIRERAKIAQDVLNRIGLGATSKLLVQVNSDPVEALFASILSDPQALRDTTVVQMPALPARDEQQERVDRLAEGGGFTYDDLLARRAAEDIVEADVVEDAPHTTYLGMVETKTPPHIRRAMEELL